MNPSAYLAILLALSAGIGLWHVKRRKHAQRQLRGLATAWRMNYSPGDPLRLTQRIAARFPIAGAAHVSITDLIYGVEGDTFRYFLAAEFTVGLLRAKRRVRRVITFTEPRGGGQKLFSTMRVASADLPFIEQFETLRDRPDEARIVHLRPDVT